ncbi:uncharacterized protein C21orf58 [Callorhinchus milii]|uniref:uncharacterized protein C21orf58 n=1 Tax=Callorhinchus milii TaxID=7868 RepID=UPI001C3FB0C7|nr:uncharacterized protein C21orf58 [Callorhinchus milii]
MEIVEPTLRDQLTRLHLKLLEEKLQTEREDLEEQTDNTPPTAESGDGQRDALHHALRRRKCLLHRLREQQAMASPWPHTWGGTRRHYLEPLQQPAPIHLYQPMPAEAPRVIQHTLPLQPAAIVQQLPQPQPLITQLLPPHPPIRSGSIKDDMVELMLMQNAQMHQIIMHNMMLKALPPTAFSPALAPAAVTPAQVGTLLNPFALPMALVSP